MIGALMSVMRKVVFAGRSNILYSSMACNPPFALIAAFRSDDSEISISLMTVACSYYIMPTRLHKKIVKCRNLTFFTT